MVNNVEIPKMLLLGPGPSNSNPKAETALGLPQLGYLDPFLIDNVLRELCQLLRHVFQTKNEVTFPVTGTGMTAWETVMSNLIEPHDRVLICSNGFFGERCTEMVPRYGADMCVIRKRWGEVFDLQEINSALSTHKPTIMWICHAETSTGALQPMDGIGDLCHSHGCLCVVDCVTSLGTSPVLIDTWAVDAAYSCSQKGLSCPPGCSPVTFGERAMQKVNQRPKENSQRNVPWSMDLNLLTQYFFKQEGAPRKYHHTVSSTMWYALKASLNAISDEGLEETWNRHKIAASELYEKLEAIGFEMLIPDQKHRSPALTTVKVPNGVDPALVIKKLREVDNIEIGGGLGELAGKVFRIGLMGYNSRPDNVGRLIKTIKLVLSR